MSKIYIENSTFMEYIDEIATRITEERFGEETWISEDWDSENEDHCVNRFTDKAQDFYNETYDEFETLANNLLGVYNNSELDNLEDIAKSYRELKLKK
jgi:regulation of enolase protein 1 (concanavalin A-like superfamily)